MKFLNREKLECTVKTDTPTLNQRWSCGCVKCKEVLKDAGWGPRKGELTYREE
jgi:uncharacterized paraquat-inducible protein A